MGDKDKPTAPDDLAAVVNEVVAEAHVRLEELRPEERAFLEQHALKKPLRVLDIWALGVGVVVAGAYFGWNLGLKDNGPVAMLIASLIVSLLYLTWVLALAELSVAMPFAGGPLAYGRRTGSPLLGFIMGWSMVLESLFAAIGTALATGGYVAFLLDPKQPSDTVKVAVGLVTVALFFLLQAWGVKEQSWAMIVMTYGALLGLVLFWVVAATNFSWQRVWLIDGRPLPGSGWRAVLDAVPYALWWLVMIETVALAAEESHEPHRTIPRGLTWAQLTLIAIVVLTWLFACGALDSQELASTPVLDEAGQPVLDDAGQAKRESVDYPLAKAIRSIPAGQQSPALVYGFGIIALCGLIASYHGMLYATSRQVFSLGRAGYLPPILGKVHVTRRTPVVALLACSLIAAVFVIARLWKQEAVDVAVLVSTLTALVWYILAMICLYVLRRREPQLFRAYRAPVYRLLPLVVIALSVFAAVVYSGANNAATVLPLTAGLYAVGLGYYGIWGRRTLQEAAPEELAARHAAAPNAEVPR
jgi:ethanolamine permease